MNFAALSYLVGLSLAAGSVAYSTTSTPASRAPEAPAQTQVAQLAKIHGLTGKNMVENGDFADGDTGWAVRAPGADVTIDRSGRGGSEALVVHGTRAARVRLAYDLGTQTLPAGTQVTSAVWLRANRLRQEVRLTLDEIHRDGDYQPVHETGRTYNRAWETVRTTAVTEQSGSRLRLRIDVPRLPAGAVLRIDDVLVSRDERPTVPVGPWSERLDNGCAVSRRGVPACSAYFGAAYELNDDPTAWERALGRPLGVRRTYFDADTVDSAMATVRADLAAGRLPWISFKMPYSWAEMAAGRGDRWVLAVSRRLAQVPGPVWLAFHHEPEGDGDIRDWTAMQQRLAPMVRTTAPNVAYTIVLTGWNQLHGDRQYRLPSIWPKGTKIDVAGFDIYNFRGVRQDGTLHRRTTPLSKSYFTPLSRWARKQGVAWAVAETGYTDTAARQDPAWLYRTYQQMLHHGGVAFTYFNSTANSIAPWALGTPDKRKQFEYAIRPTPRL